MNSSSTHKQSALKLIRSQSNGERFHEIAISSWSQGVTYF